MYGRNYEDANNPFAGIPRQQLVYRMKLLAENVPLQILHHFHNEFQFAAVIAKVEHGFAARLDSLEKLLDYFKDHPGLIAKAFGGLVPRIAMSDIMLQMNNVIFNYVSDAVRELYDSLKLIVKHSEFVCSEVEENFGDGDSEFLGLAGSFLGDILNQDGEYDVGMENADTSFSSRDHVGLDGLGAVGSTILDILDKAVESSGDVGSADTSFESEFSDLPLDVVGAPVFDVEN